MAKGRDFNMDCAVLCKSVKLAALAAMQLDYYIIPENISAAYCDLKCYGIRVEKTTVYEGGGKIIETKQINNVFYREKDALEFVSRAAQRKIEPEELRAFMEKYITESLDRAKQKA